MGKGARSRINYAEKKAAALEREQAKKKQQKINLIISLAVVVALLAGIGTLVGINVYRNSGAAQRAQIVMKTDNFEVNGSMMSYFIFSQYANYLNTYGDYLSYTGLDTAKALKDQYTTDSENNTITWFEYFADAAKEDAEKLLVLCEDANANGVALTDVEKKAADDRAEQSYTNVGQYAQGVKKQDVIDCVTLSMLATKYQLVLEGELTPTVEEIQAYYDKDPLNVLKADYYSFTFSYQEAKEGEKLAEGAVTQSAAKAEADKLAAATGVEDFKTKLDAYLKATHADHEGHEDGDHTSVDTYKATAAAYNKDSEAIKWIFADSTAVGAVKMFHDEEANTYSVYVLDKAKYLQQEETVSVRHLLVSVVEGSVTAQQAHDVAQGYYDQWLKGDKTEQAFAELAMLHTEDSNYYNGGLYQGVYAGQMVETFNDWCFDEARQSGDTGLVDTEYGTHVMYFVGDDLPRWQTNVRSTLLSEAYEAKYEELKKATSVQIENDLISALEVQ